MIEPITYRIETLSDFAKVPADRLEACLRDFQYAIGLHMLAFGGEAERTPIPGIDWRDDGNHSVDLFDSDGNSFLSLEVKDSE